MWCGSQSPILAQQRSSNTAALLGLLGSEARDEDGRGREGKKQGDKNRHENFRRRTNTEIEVKEEEEKEMNEVEEELDKKNKEKETDGEKGSKILKQCRSAEFQRTNIEYKSIRACYYKLNYYRTTFKIIFAITILTLLIPNYFKWCNFGRTKARLTLVQKKSSRSERERRWGMLCTETALTVITSSFLQQDKYG